MALKEYPFEFPPGQHGDCQTLTELTIEHLPRDGSLGRVELYDKNAVVWQPDNLQDQIYFLQKGNIVIFLSDQEGRETVLQTVDFGKPFGELCFCGKYKLRGTFARAVAPSQAVAINLADFMDYMQAKREVLAALVWTYCVRLADAQRRIEILANRGAEDRLGNLLLHLAVSRNQKYNEPSKIIDSVKLAISQGELAQMAAMSRPQVNVTMVRFRKQGLVEYGRNHPLIVHVPALRKYLARE